MQDLEIFKEVLDTIARYYAKDYHVEFGDVDTAYCDDEDTIVIPPKLTELFYKNNLPRFSVFYHELGHAEFSHGSWKFIENWKNMPSNTLYQYDRKYLYLLNWIEDFYIEDMLVYTYPYLKDIIKCLRLIPFEYNITDRDKAFHYYYINKKVSPTFNAQEQQEFISYLHNLITLRKSERFNMSGAISMFNKNDYRLKFIKEFINFYNWCINKNIIPKDVSLPPLQLPTNIIVKSTTSTPTNTVSNNSLPNGNIQTDVQTINPNVYKDTIDNSGTSSDHSHIVGKIKYIEVFPKVDPNVTLFSKELQSEERMLNNAIGSYRIEADNTTLDGLFTNNYYDTNIISKPNIPRFFNIHRLEDRMLFLQPGRAYHNVSIYRDISGSTYGKVFDLMDDICNYLNTNIPIDNHFYLYASGNISILETEYKHWYCHEQTPDIYTNDPIFKQMGAGTNSDAVADVISQQMDDKWLNIIITDGDLDALFKRDNIKSLLNNVAIISVGTDTINSLINPEHYIFIKDVRDIPKINNMLINFRKDNN